MAPSERPKTSERPKSERPSSDDSDWRALLEGALVAVLESADEGILVFDRNGKCRMIGRRIADLFGIDPAQYVGKMREEVLGILSRSCDEPSAFLDAVGEDDLIEPSRVVGELDLVSPR